MNRLSDLNKKAMKFLFIVQGEGRGHMTQAISLAGILQGNGHEIEKVFLGTSRRRIVPEFFRNEFREKLEFFRSPNFWHTRDKKGILVGRSLLMNLLISPRYIAEIIRMAGIIRKSNADVIVNFYDMIGGLGMYFSFSGKKYYVVSHHFYYSRGGFTWPEGRPLMKYLLKLHSFLCSRGANAKLILSFRDQSVKLKRKSILVPPLLRNELFSLASADKGYMLVYILNEGFLEEICLWSLKYPEIKMILFGDFKDIPQNVSDNIEMRQLDGRGFLTAMSGCKALISTAGFESVCEAAYLGKDIWLIPSKNHYEQECNALDASSAGLALSFTEFSPDFHSSHERKEAIEEFRIWCNKADKIFVKILCSG